MAPWLSVAELLGGLCFAQDDASLGLLSTTNEYIEHSARALDDRYMSNLEWHRYGVVSGNPIRKCSENVPACACSLPVPAVRRKWDQGSSLNRLPSFMYGNGTNQPVVTRFLFSANVQEKVQPAGY